MEIKFSHTFVSQEYFMRLYYSDFPFSCKFENLVYKDRKFFLAWLMLPFLIFLINPCPMWPICMEPTIFTVLTWKLCKKCKSPSLFTLKLIKTKLLEIAKCSFFKISKVAYFICLVSSHYWDMTMICYQGYLGSNVSPFCLWLLHGRFNNSEFNYFIYAFILLILFLWWW